MRVFRVMESPSRIGVRPCREADLPHVLEIERGSFPYPYSPEVFEELLKEDVIFLVAEDAGGIRGYVAADVAPGGRGLIISVAVHPQYRGRGIGTRLMCEALQRLRGRCSRVMLHVAAKNSVGQAFYLRFGFKPMGLIRRYYPDGDDAIVLESSVAEALEKVCSRLSDKFSGHP